MADTDPLNYRQRRHPDLDVRSHGLTLWDLDREFPVGGFNGAQFMKLRDVLGVLRDAYCRTVGVEYMHITDPVKRRWLQQRLETKRPKPAVERQKYLLGRLNAAEAFETFLQTKYVGQKRFSLEGGETVIPLLDAVLNKAAEYELDEVVIGMAHRGRLNVLANIVGKPYAQIFREFEGNLDPGQAHGSGDVKYHLGAEGKYVRPFGDGQVDVTLVANPSHLEVVDPVLEGVVRAKQDIINRGESGVLGAADRAARRRRVRRPGRGRRDAEPVQAARVPHRRHCPRDHQQPGRVHHRAGGVAVERVLHRRREDDRGAGLPRERGRPRGRGVGRRAGGRLPAGVRQRRRDRHGLLPPARPQRGRRPLDDQPADVPDHRRQAVGPKDLHRGSDRPRRPVPGGRRRGAARLPHPAGAGVQRGPRAGEVGGARIAVGRGGAADPAAGGHQDQPRAAGADRRRRRWSSRPDSCRTRGSRRCWSAGSRCRARAASTGRSARSSRSARPRSTAGSSGWPARTRAAARSSSGMRR